MALADELAYMTATELAGRVRRRELSPVQVVDAFIERIEARNQSLNAFVYSGFDDARQRAREAEEALMSGAELGVLHGVPTAIKELFDFQSGWPATFGGIRALKDFTLDISCAFAERIQRAGAIVVGKTNSPIMGFRGTCDNEASSVSSPDPSGLDRIDVEHQATDLAVGFESLAARTTPQVRSCVYVFLVWIGP